MPVTLNLRNTNATDPNTARQLTLATGSSDQILTSAMLGSSYAVVFTGWVTDGYGYKRIQSGTWTIRIRCALDPAEDTTNNETNMRVKIYKRSNTNNNLLGTSSGQTVNGTTMTNRTFTISIGQIDLTTYDDIYLDIEALDSLSDSKLQVNIENSSNQCYVEHPDFVPELDQEGYGWRNDDGSETSATWATTQDTKLYLPKKNVIRLRTIVNVFGGDPTSKKFILQYRKKISSETGSLDTLNNSGSTSVGFGDTGNNREYMCQGFIPDVDIITDVSFYLVSKSPDSNQGYLIWIDRANANSEPLGQAHVGIGGVTMIPNSSLVTGALTKYTLTTPVYVERGQQYCVCFAPWNTSTNSYSADYREFHSATNNPYANGRRVHLDGSFSNPTAPNSGNNDLRFEIYGIKRPFENVERG